MNICYKAFNKSALNNICPSFFMADLTVNTNTSTFTSSSAKGDQREEIAPGETIFKPHPNLKYLPKLEDVESKYRERILALPKEQGWLTPTLRKYKGFWCGDQLFPAMLAMEESFKPRPNDVIITSFPKSGTTWVKALAFTIVHRDKYSFSSHPLLKFNPHDCVPFIDYQYAMRDDQYLETLPSPRVLGTHMAYSTLPESIKASKCRIVYICREPKDVIVSLLHMIEKKDWYIEKQFSFSKLFELFCKGQTPYGPFWDHVLEYYTESLHNTNKILFLKYEEIMKNPVDGVMRIASFIGCPFSEEEVKLGEVEKIVEFCSFNKLKNLDVNKNGIGNRKNDIYFRKAIVGDWQNYMTTEMADNLNDIIKEKFCHSGFTYGA